MGQDKALLEVNGRAFLEHALATARSLSSDVVLVVDRADRYSHFLAAFPDVRVVADVFPNAGPVAGIVTGLQAAGSGAHWVVPCDMPLLNRNVLQQLRDACEPSWDVVVPEIDGEPEPLVAVYRDTALPKLRDYLESGRRSARRALAELRVKTIGEQTLRQLDPALVSFQNVNTHAEFTLLHKARVYG